MSPDNTVLSHRGEDRKQLREQLEATLEALNSSYSDESAFSGIDPNELRRRIGQIDILPEEGLGFDAALDLLRREVLPHMLRTWSVDYMPHLHSPALMESIPAELVISTYNNSMDSWDQGPAATEIEVRTIRELCRLFGYTDDSDGVFTSGGSQSNISAAIIFRDMFIEKLTGRDVKKHGLPDDFYKLRLYTSEISHFSFYKGAHMMGLGYDSVVKLPVDEKERIDIGKAREIIKEDYERGLHPFLIAATIGTTDFGSIDDIQQLREIADEFGMFLHADAAYGSGAILSSYRKRIGDLSLADSITVDFHKMFLLPISASALLVRNGKNLDVFRLLLPGQNQSDCHRHQKDA